MLLHRGLDSSTRHESEFAREKYKRTAAANTHLRWPGTLRAKPMLEQAVRPRLKMPTAPAPKRRSPGPVRRPILAKPGGTKQPKAAPGKPGARQGATKLKRPAAKKQRKGACPKCEEAAKSGKAAPCPTCNVSPELERPPVPSMKGTPSDAHHPAERQADAIGARIGASLASVPSFGPGPLPPHARAAAEPHLGVSLAGTQLRADRGAQRKAASESALAVTEGRTVSFAAGQFSSATSAGRALIGHELTHVGQQATHARAVQLRAEEGIGATGAVTESACAEEAKCPTGHDPESRYAAAHGGEVFDARTNEVILWNFCVGSPRPRQAHATNARLKALVKKWRAMMAKNRGLRLRVVGGASASGQGRSNNALGLARARCVKLLLASMGLDAARIDATTSGARRPLAPNTTPANMARNRRVELGLYSGARPMSSLPAWIAVSATSRIGAVPKLSWFKPWSHAAEKGAPAVLPTATIARRFHPLWFPQQNIAGVQAQGLAWEVADVTVVSLVDAPVRVGFLQLLLDDERRGAYREPAGATEVLDYGHCMGRDLPCRDVASAEDVLVRPHGNTPLTRILSLNTIGSKSGRVMMVDNPGVVVPIRYPSASSGPFVLDRLVWHMKFAVMLAAFDASSSGLVVLSHAGWEVGQVVEFHIRVKGHRIVSHRRVAVSSSAKHSGFQPGAPSHVNLARALNGPTCRANARATDTSGKEPCEPFVSTP